MKFNTLKETIMFRITENEEKYWIEDYWNLAIENFSKDIQDTIYFIQNDCTDEEFYWLSEIFEELVQKTQSKMLIEVLYKRLLQIREENFNQNNFKSEYLQKEIDYKTFVKDIENEIVFVENQLIK